MPKESKKPNSPRETPYSADMGSRARGRLDDFDQEKDLWGESKCPICLDHPHNAVLLRCSSPHCRPFMCHTTDLLSNCFNEFCRSHSVAAPSESGGKFGDPIACPLCRGELTGWVVVEPARESMDKLVRNCSRDWCEFSGNYADLMKHAEEEHDVEFDGTDEVDDYGLEEGDEDADEGTFIRPRLGETFLDHIHFGGPDERIVSEEWSVSDGVVNYRRTTTLRTYEYEGTEATIDQLRAM